jgi:hypothetical protein
MAVAAYRNLDSLGESARDVMRVVGWDILQAAPIVVSSLDRLLLHQVPHTHPRHTLQDGLGLSGTLGGMFMVLGERENLLSFENIKTDHEESIHEDEVQEHSSVWSLGGSVGWDGNRGVGWLNRLSRFFEEGFLIKVRARHCWISRSDGLI